MLNQKVLNYQIFRKIGIGNYVKLYEAFEENDPQKKVVIKIYDGEIVKESNVRKKFKELAEKIINLEHPNLLKEIKYEIREDKLIQISELLDGQNLKFAVLIKGISRQEDINLFKQILEAIRVLHKNKIVHRDIKPENVFLIKNYTEVKMLDNGIAGVFSYDHPDKINKRIDAPMFLSPEQARDEKDIDHRADIYALGVLLYFIYNRKLPFENTNSYQDILQQIIKEPIPKLLYNSEINTIIQKATQKDRNKRYQSIDDFFYDINKIKI